MKGIYWMTAGIGAIAMLVAILLTSIQLLVGTGTGFFEREYKKYAIPAHLSISMENLLVLTEEIMDYINGEQNSLEIVTVIDGREQEFFNEIEKQHLLDVRILFAQGRIIRRVCIGIFIFICLVLAWQKQNWLFMVARAYTFVFGFTLVLSGGMAVLISIDFTKYFILFHEILFQNDLWWLNPKTSRLVNLVPEPFFIDTAIGILILFLLVSGLFCLLGLLLQGRKIKQHPWIRVWKDREQI